MKIVDVSEFYAERGGGVRVYTLEKLRAGTQAGHEITIIAPGPKDDEQICDKGGRIIWVKSNPDPLDPRYYLLRREAAVREILTRENPDVVEGSSTWAGGWFAARWPGRALKALIFHEDPVAVWGQTFLGPILGADRVDRLFFAYWMYLRRLSKHFDVTTVSGAWLKHRLSRFGVERVETVPFGIEKKHFAPTRRDPEARKQLLTLCGLPETAPLLISVSRHHPEKRLGTVIDAVKRVNRTQPVGLVLFGDGPLRRWTEYCARNAPNIHIAGFTYDRAFLSAAIASADALVHGSSAETYGLAVAEAICSGTPIVVPDRGGAFDLAQPSYAEDYPPGDAKACAAAIRRLLDRDRPMLQAACADAATHRIRSMDEHFEALFALYEQELGDRKTRATKLNLR
ncbi:glycosyltransferase [Altericista sp. CCNU0014]|uniref:glycosyltransferase n=1 Tax=Altericista sp. CCNU0014 TaxID=3082949 RepID=UPI00384E9598